MRGLGQKAWAGWFEDDKIEQLTKEWTVATTPEARTAAAAIHAPGSSAGRQGSTLVSPPNSSIANSSAFVFGGLGKYLQGIMFALDK